MALGAGAAWGVPWSLPLGAGEADTQWITGLPRQGVVDGRELSEPVSAPLAFSALGVRAPADAEVWVRTAADAGGEWSEWRSVLRTLDEAPDPDADERTDTPTRPPLWVGEARMVQAAVAGAGLGEVELLLIDSVGLDGLPSVLGALALAGRGAGPAATPAAHAAAAQPPIILRPEWGAAPGGRPRYAQSARFAVLHHTVTTNRYGPGDSPGMVRAIQRYHMQAQGWKDIGYNFLVDRHGQIFEGRHGGMDRAVVGAHAGGFNVGSIGIALIGDHRRAGVTEAALGSLRDLLVWLCALHGIDPLATTVETSRGSTKYPPGARARLDCLSGHRDASETSCPGGGSYQVLGSLREAVAARLRELEAAPQVPTIPRLGGKDGVATAVLVSKTAFARGEADRAVIANDRVFADAAAAGPLAGPDGPVLLTRPDVLDERVREELERVLPQGERVYLLGGPDALSPHVERQLGDRWIVRRLAGWDRTSTAAMAAERVVAERGNRTALVTRAGPDDAWSDALAAGAYGARHGTPLLLTDTHHLSPATRAAIVALRIERTIVIGGPEAVSPQVMAELPNPRRVAARERAGTAVAVARELWGVAEGVVIAGGYRTTAWKDPLAAAPLAARREAPVVVVDTHVLPPATEGCLRELGSRGLDAAGGLVVGGHAAVAGHIARGCAGLLG